MACRWCGSDEAQFHQGILCPMVKALDFDPDGTVRRVEFLTPRDYPAQRVVIPSVPENYAKLTPSPSGATPNASQDT